MSVWGPNAKRWLPRAVAGLVAVLLLWLLLGWLQLRGDPREAAPMDAAALVGQAVWADPGREADDTARTLPHAARASAVGPAAMALAGAGPAPSPPPPGVLDLCGLGRLPLPWGFPAAPTGLASLARLPPHLVAEPAAEAMVRTLAALRQGSPAQRAAALHMLPAEPSAERLADTAELQLLALQTRDPLALTWAMDACARRGASCDPQLLPAWLQSEPDNLAPWMRLWADEAARAKATGQPLAPARVDELLAGMAQTRHHSLHFGRMTGTVMPAVPADVPGYLRMVLAIDLIGRDAAISMVLPESLFAACRSAAEATPPDPGRLNRCNAVAQVMAGHSDTLVGVGIGIRLGQRIGWPAAQVKQMRADVDALQAGAPDIDERQPLACAAIAPMEQHLAQVAALGEVAALRQRAAARAGAASAPR